MDWSGLKSQIEQVRIGLPINSVPHMFINDASGFTVNECLQWIKDRHEEAFPDGMIPIYGGYCEGSYQGDADFLLIEPTTGKFYEIHGSHCSCYGFEGQFIPSECPIEYLAKGKQWENAYETVLEVVEYFEKNPIN